MSRTIHHLSAAFVTAMFVILNASIAPAQTFTFQQGLDGYAGASDTMLHGAHPDTDYSTDAMITVDGEDGGLPSQVLIRFDGIVGDGVGQIPQDTVIASAILRLRSLDDGNGGQLHAMLVDWSDNSTWESLSGGVSADGAEAQASADDGVSSNSPSTYVDLDVTATVQAWIHGTPENKGWVLLPNAGTSNGWDIASSEHTTASYRPQLIVSLPEPPPAPPAEVTVLQPVTSTSPTLQLKVVTPDEQPGTVTFYGRRAPDPEEFFTIIALPDTQKYVVNGTYAHIFTAQTQWIVDNKEALNIVFVIHEGDIVDNWNNTTEWEYADASMSLLDGVVPYSVVPGDHDHYGEDPPGSTAYYEQYFPASRFEQYEWWGGSYAGDYGKYNAAYEEATEETHNNNNYQLLTIMGQDYIFLSLDFCPSQDEVDWANGVLAAHADRKAILTTHGLLDTSANYYGSGDFWLYPDGTSNSGDTSRIWTDLIRNHANLQLVLCGHMHGESRRTDYNLAGNPVHQLMANYQSRSNGGDGWLRIMRFVPAENKIYVYTYSPWHDAYETDADSQFELDYPLAWYNAINQQASIASGSTVSTVWSDLEPETNYEWFVHVTDSQGNVSAGPLWMFTTQSLNAPTAEDDAYSVDEDALLEVTADIGVLANDTDSTGNPLMNATVVTNCAHGVLALNADGSFTYQPDADFCGEDAFTYSAETAEGTSDTGTVTITVNAINDAPVAQDQTVSTDEDVAVSITLTAADVDGDALTFGIVDEPSYGMLDIEKLPDVLYTPVAGYSGSDSFTFVVNDGSVDSDIGTVSVTVIAVNHAPTADPKSAEVAEDGSVQIPLSGSDPEEDPLTFAIAQAPVHGTLSEIIDATVTYTSDADYNGPDSFTYTASDGVNTSTAAATVTITVMAVNDAPVAGDDTAETMENTAVVIPVLANDTDVDADDTLTVTGVGTPSNGEATISDEGSTVTYTPLTGFHGEDSFAYTVTDSGGLTATAQVTVTVTEHNDPPVAAGDSYSVDEDTSLSVPAAGVLANDTDAEGDPLTAALVSDAGNGTLALNTDGSFAYTPNADWNGTDTFTYTAYDGRLASEPATVTITVNPVNDTPVADAQTVSVSEDGSVDITLTGSDVDGDNLTYAIVDQPTHGALTGVAPVLTYTPSRDYHGTDSLIFKVNDGTNDSAPATVTITVNPVNDPPVAADDTAVTNEDTAVTIDVLGNDSDPDGDVLTVQSVTQGTSGTVEVAVDGQSVVYTPDADFHGTDSFGYTVSDNNGGYDTATVQVTINGVNDSPVANDDAYSTDQDTPLTVVAPGVLGNDQDVDGDGLTASLVSGPDNGAVALSEDGSFTYTPNTGFTGTDSFSYTVSDGRGGSASAVVEVTVAPSSPTIVVDGIEMSLVPAGRNWKGQAIVTLAPALANATITCNWYLDTDILATGQTAITDASGQAVIVSVPIKAASGQRFIIEITDVALTGYEYAPGVDTGEISVP